MIPTIGRTVHFVTSTGKHRLAFVVNVHDPKDPSNVVPEGRIEVEIHFSMSDFMCGSDGRHLLVYAAHDEAGAPTTWHWPEREVAP